MAITSAIALVHANDIIQSSLDFITSSSVLYADSANTARSWMYLHVLFGYYASYFLKETPREQVPGLANAPVPGISTNRASLILRELS